MKQNSINKWCQLEYITVDRLLGRGLKTVYMDYKVWADTYGFGVFHLDNFVSSIISQYKLSTLYDLAMKDQMITGSDFEKEFCPYDQTLSATTYN